MKHLKILNTREKKEILEFIGAQWGADPKKAPDILKNAVFLISTKYKLYLISREFEKLDDKRLNIDSAGLYFAEIGPGKVDKIRLSIEGSQIVGPHAKKNMVELDDEEAAEWLSGKDIPKDCGKCSGFLIIRKNDTTSGSYDFIGSGKYIEKDKKILNYVSKARRIGAIAHD